MQPELDNQTGDSAINQQQSFRHQGATSPAGTTSHHSQGSLASIGKPSPSSKLSPTEVNVSGAGGQSNKSATPSRPSNLRGLQQPTQQQPDYSSQQQYQPRPPFGGGHYRMPGIMGSGPGIAPPGGMYPGGPPPGSQQGGGGGNWNSYIYPPGAGGPPHMGGQPNQAAAYGSYQPPYHNPQQSPYQSQQMGEGRGRGRGPQNLGPEMMSKTNLYLRGLAPDITDKHLREMCKQYGNITSTKAIIDGTTNKCKGYGFVDFDNADNAQNAVRELRKQGIQAQMARQQEQDPTNLYIANLPPFFAENNLHDLFLSYGNVVSTRVLRDQRGQSRCVGFVRMDAREICEKIIEKFNGTLLAGCQDPLLVKLADSGNKKNRNQPGVEMNDMNAPPSDTSGNVYGSTINASVNGDYNQQPPLSVPGAPSSQTVLSVNTTTVGQTGNQPLSQVTRGPPPVVEVSQNGSGMLFDQPQQNVAPHQQQANSAGVTVAAAQNGLNQVTSFQMFQQNPRAPYGISTLPLTSPNQAYTLGTATAGVNMIATGTTGSGWGVPQANPAGAAYPVGAHNQAASLMGFQALSQGGVDLTLAQQMANLTLAQHGIATSGAGQQPGAGLAEMQNIVPGAYPDIAR